MSFQRCCLLSCFVMAILGCSHESSSDLATNDTTIQPDTSTKQTLSQNDRSKKTTATLTLEDDLDQAANLIAAKRLAEAQSLLKRCFVTDPENLRALELSGDLLWVGNQPDEAIAMYRSMLDLPSDAPRPLYSKTIDACLQNGRPFTAVEILKQAIDAYPKHTQFHYDIAGISAAIGVVDESIPSLKTLIRHGLEDVETLVIASNPDRVKPDWEYLYELVRRYPGSEELQLGLASIDFSNLRYGDAAEKLELLLDRQPNFDKARLLHGRCLVEMNDGEKLQEWLTKLPDHLRDNAMYWYVAGRWAQSQQNYPQACHAFWSALNHDPTHFRAMTDLHQSLLQTDRTEEARKVAEVVELETQLRSQLDDFFAAEQNSQRISLAVAETLQQLGRQWEADAWARMGVKMTNEPIANSVAKLKAIRDRLTVKTPWQKPSMNLASSIDLSTMPTLEWEFSNTQNRSIKQRSQRPPVLANQAIKMGYEHTSIPGLEIGKHGFWIYQALGGGISIVDFDLDGWPDLASAVLDGKPLKRESSPNELHRNLNGKFVSCCSEAGYNDIGFGQGIAVGDVNGDGFPDLYDSNIGESRYYQNNGDGTFTDLTEQLGISGSRWATSVVIADFDSDGNADIFETCYCGGTDPYTEHCGGDSEVVTCSPLKFDAESDVLWRGQATLGVTNSSDQLGPVAAPGRGLGLVTGFLDEAPGLDCYVANDMSANHLWSASSSNSKKLLREQGTIRGLGLSGISKAQASMGIAAADPDHDGDIDFYVTHFTTDYNTFYEQVAPGSWVDRTVQKGLLDPTMRLLGFGTQWVDLGNRNSLQLFVANGHVNQVEQSAEAFRMPPQLFDQDADGRWNQLDADQMGQYFQSSHLGRAVAIADLNRDHRNDLAVSHVDTPNALLINESPDVGSAIRFYLKATQSHRDAIGAKVSLTLNGHEHVYQLLAGNGFMCANECCLHVGLGDEAIATNVTVTWPSGKTQPLGNLDADRDYLLIEDQSAFEIADQVAHGAAPVGAVETE
ncbi:FG-GAP-like repeat-containing protein [Rhodopirellula bahusiensis]|nr:FG-GAP-like repeat-containing protein [Rhodopirellula bahusiensis]